MPTLRDTLTKRFRKVAWGRLYWRYHYGRPNQHIDSDDVCIVRDGTLTTHYKTMAAFIEDLEHAEETDKNVMAWLFDHGE